MNLMEEITKKQNRAFTKMNRQRKRVAIAKDVLKMLDARKIVAAKMVYVESDGRFGVTKQKEENASVASFVNSVQCKTCALGAAFCALAVRLDDKLKISDLKHSWGTINDNDMRIQLSKYFTHDELHAIENAFEGFNGVQFNAGITNTETRLRRVMQKIIDAKGGTFKFE